MPTPGLRNVIDCLRTAASLQEALRLTDGELLGRYVAGRDEVAFEALVRRHGPMVLGVCRRLLANPCDAEDAFQATFLVLVRKARSVWPRAKLASWLYGVAYRAAQKARAATVRRQAREKQVQALPEPATVADGLWQDLVPLLDQELSRLPDKYRLPLVLCDLEGRTRTEAAAHLGWPEGTVAGRLARGRALLARRLARHGLPLSGGVVTALLAQNAASACVPAALVAATGKAAAVLAAGPAAAAGVVSTKVTILSTGVLQAMLRDKLKVVIAGALLVAVTLGFAGVLMHRAWAERPTEPGEVARAAEPPAATAKGEARKPKDEDAIQGNWKVANLQQVNHEPTKDEQAAFKAGALKVVITADKIIYPDKSEATYKLDPSKIPKRIDITVASDKKTVTVPGIYSLEGGELKLCYGREGDDRPPASFDVKKAKPGMFPSCWTLRKDDPPRGKGKDVEKKTDPQEDAAAKELKALQGDWKVVGLEADGRKASADEVKGMRWTFKGARILATNPGGKPGEMGEVKFDPGKNPKHLDLVSLEGASKGRTLLGIYKLEKGRLTICLRDDKASKKGRPTEFSAGTGSDQGLITLESLQAPPKPAAEPEPQPGKAEADVMQDKRWVVKGPDLLQLVGPAGAVGTPVKLPRFRLEPGQELTYPGETQSTGARGVTSRSRGEWRIWVVRANKEDGWRLVLRSATSTSRGTGGYAAQEIVSFSWCDLFPDGRLVENDSSGLSLEARFLLARLPSDAAEAARGWATNEERAGQTYCYRLLPAATAGRCALEAVRESPQDTACGVTIKEVFTWDTGRGLPEAMQLEITYADKRRERGALKLGEVKTHDPVWCREFAADAERYFAAEATYRRALARQGSTPAELKTALEKALADLQAARPGLERPEFRQRLDALLAEHEQQARAVVEAAERRASVLGRPAPDWTTTDLEGKPHTLTDYRGKVVLLDFWYRQCFWCVRTLPQVKEIATRFKGQPVIVLGMNTDPREEDARFVVAKMGLNYPNLKAAGLPEKYRVQGFPTLVVIDRQGVVRDIHVGYSPSLKEEVIQSVERLLKAKP